MKINKILSIMAVAALFTLGACMEKDPDNLPEPGEFSGTVTCQYQGTWYDTEGIKASISISDDKKTADITLYGVKFVPQMPVTIDVTISGATLKASGDEYIIRGNKIIPTMANGEAVDMYVVTGLIGELSHDELEFELNFGAFPTKYDGDRL